LKLFGLSQDKTLRPSRRCMQYLTSRHLANEFARMCCSQ